MEQRVDNQDSLTRHPAASATGNFCRVDGGVLSHPFDDDPPSPLTRFVHESFRALALNERFSCVGGRTAIRREAYRFGLYDRLGSQASSDAVGSDLTRFIADPELRDQPLTAFVASFVDPVPSDEAHFEALLWSTVGINIVGSFLLGLLVAENWFDRDIREGLGVGFLGGLTTFSTFSVQAVLEVDAGEPARAMAYVLASVLGGLAAATAGYALGRWIA